MDRLILYSLERQKPVRMIYMQNGEMVQRNVQVEKIDGDAVSVCVSKGKKHIVIDKNDILSVDFRKNDDSLK